MSSYSLSKYQAKQSCPATLHNSTQVSFQQPYRKYSMMEINNRIDIDQLMVDIKLTPLKNNQFYQKIKTIYNCLQYLKKFSPSLIQQVRTAQLVIQSIQNKYHKNHLQTKRNIQTKRQSQPIIQTNSKIVYQQLFPKQSNKKNQSSHKKTDSQILSKRKPNFNILNSNNDISPIKQLDQATSRIVYTNFSIKDIQNSCKKQFSHHKPTPERQSMDSKFCQKKVIFNQSKSTKDIRAQSSSKNKIIHRKEGSVLTVSIFQAEDQQMQRLTRNIQALDKVLEQKGLGFKNDKNGKTALKQVTLNTSKQQTPFKSQKKPMIFNSKQKSIANRQNI